jgi:hypothetical protein
LIKKYYIEEEDGKEVKRKLSTTNDLQDLSNFSKEEVLDMYYQTSAELYSKARKIKLLENHLEKTTSGVVMDEDEHNIITDAGNNVIETIETLMN